MSITELTVYSRRLLKGRRKEMFLLCMLPLGTLLFFRLFEITIYSLLLFFGGVSPAGLFVGDNSVQTVTSVLFMLFRQIFFCPLLFAVSFRFFEIYRGESVSSISEFLTNGRFLRKSILSGIFGKILSLAAMIPTVMGFYHALEILKGGADSRDIFKATQFAVGSLIFLLLWFRIKLSLAALPFLMAEIPEKNSFSLVLYSLKFMSGRTGTVLRLFLLYLLPLVTIVGIPFVMPEIMAALAVSIDIFMKEDEQSYFADLKLREEFI